MNGLRDICITEMDQLDLRLRELGAVMLMATEAAEADEQMLYSQVFGHAKGCLDGIRAQLDDVRGAVLRLAMDQQPA